MDRTDRLRRYWDKQARSYDRAMRLFERTLAGDTRTWICRQATGEVLEVAIGTGLNLPHYPPEVRLTAVDLSPAMLDIARQRAEHEGRDVELRVGDAQELDLPDIAFDTVVCTFSLCGFPDDRRAVREMTRVLRPGGLLLLADHVAASPRPIRTLQRAAELITIPLAGEHFTRRPIQHLSVEGLSIERHERLKFGIIERLAARKSTTTPRPRTSFAPSVARTTGMATSMKTQPRRIEMTKAAEMLRTYPADLGGVDRDKLAACIDACYSCAQACTACADACLSEQHVSEMVKCVRTNLDCADVCQTTGQVLSRHTGYDANLTRAVLQACATACTSCGDECERHTDMQHCRVCSQACRECEQACRDLLDALG